MVLFEDKIWNGKFKTKKIVNLFLGGLSNNVF